MSIIEIVKRYTRGIPVDVIQRQGVFIDQNEHDLEKLHRMDFGEKADMADGLKARNTEIIKAAELTQQEQRSKDTEAALEVEVQKRVKSAKHSKSLDNTMLNDTDLSVN